MGKADLHIHTDRGDGLDSLHAILDHVEKKTDLDVISITEHDNLSVALEAREIWARGGYRFDFVPGVEVTTLDGHLVALFVEQPLRSMRPLEETIEEVRKQGGVCFVPHPLSWLARSVGPRAFDRVKAAGLWFDGIELATASPTVRFYLDKARRLNDEQYALPWVGASDAHFMEAIGSGYTVYHGRSGGDLLEAFQSGRISGQSVAFPSLREVGYRRALTVPLTGLARTPGRLMWRRRARRMAGGYAR